jgi:chorismate synthase
MNSFGRLFRIQIFGESHGPFVGVTLDGVPAGLLLTQDDFQTDLARRRPGRPGTTPRQESDRPEFLSGVFGGKTTGAPLCVRFANKNMDSRDYERIQNIPRPGHADMVARQKFGGMNDSRGGGHFSGRLTTGLVAAGVIAKKVLVGIQIQAELLSVGGRKDIQEAVKKAMDAGDSVGGLIQCRVTGLPVGLGEPFFDSVESLLAHMAFSIGGVRGIEFGTGFRSAGMHGSQCNDPLLDACGRTSSNHAGGINGGITNGNPLLFCLAVKPTSSIALEQNTFDFQAGKPIPLRVGGRHDACIALRIPVVLEAVTACVLADLMLLAQKTDRVLAVDL